MRNYIAYIRFLLALSLLTPAFAVAQTLETNVNANATVETRPATMRGNASATTSVQTSGAERAKAKAAQEIERRTAALNNLAGRIDAMKKVTPEFKQSLRAAASAQIDTLNSLRTKIAGETNNDTLKTDIQSITRDYRVFALVMPQARISAAADRITTIVNMMAGVGIKLQTRVSEAEAKGASLTAEAAALTDMGVKLQSAQAHAEAAIKGSIALTPDQGDKTKMEANVSALKAARAELQAAQQDIVAARKDLEIVIKGLRALQGGASASSTVQTQ
jgi:hypothetical protein